MTLSSNVIASQILLTPFADVSPASDPALHSWGEHHGGGRHTDGKDVVSESHWIGQLHQGNVATGGFSSIPRVCDDLIDAYGFPVVPELLQRVGS